MKKILIVLFLIGFISPVFALEYKAETPQTINKLLQQFYQEEQALYILQLHERTKQLEEK